MGRATVSLIIAGKNIDPSAVTEALGVSPTDSHRARDPSLRRRLDDRAWQIGLWEVARQNVTIDDIASEVESFIKLLHNARERFVALDPERSLLSIGLFELRGTGEVFCLEPEIMRRLAALGLILMVDAYGGAEEDPASPIHQP